MEKELPRVLGFWDSVAIGIASMIGAGIFVVSGIGASIAGSAVIIAFVIAGAVALFNALSSAELAAAMPKRRRHIRVRQTLNLTQNRLHKRLAFHLKQDA